MTNSRRGVQAFDGGGRDLGTTAPEKPSNGTSGGRDLRTLSVTVQTSVTRSRWRPSDTATQRSEGPIACRGRPRHANSIGWVEVADQDDDDRDDDEQLNQCEAVTENVGFDAR